MDIKPSEVESIKVIGKLNDDEVKLIRTTGGFNIAIGKKKKNSKPEALAAASHPALVSHQLCKQFKGNFEPALAKSEQDQLPIVEDKNSLMPDDLYNKGYELYILSKNNNLDFILYKHGLSLAEYNTEYINDELNINSYNFKKNLLPDQSQVEKILAKCIQEKMSELGIKKVNK